MEQERCPQDVLADRLGVSAPALSTYMTRKKTMGGDVLARAFADLGISIDYHDKRIVATERVAPSISVVSTNQLSFEFDQELFLEGKDGSIAISVKPVQSERLAVTLRLIPRAG
jgi:transcriptional regulator with XRE-family HTH domain